MRHRYYCFIEKKLQWEKYTQTVNKSEGRIGFGARTTAAVNATLTTESSAPRMGFGVRVTPVADAIVSEDKTTEVDMSASSDLLHGRLTRE